MEAIIKAPVTAKTQHFYGFVQGDVTGLLVSVQAAETFRAVLEQLLQSSDIRTGNSAQYQVMHRGKPMPLDARIQETDLKDFERIDLIKMQDLNA